MPRRRPAPLIAALAVLLPVLAACSGSGHSLGPHGEIAPVGERVPAAEVTGRLITGGGEFDLASLRGKVVVLNAFGSWCEPCQEESPTLRDASKAAAPMGVQFVGLDERDTDSDALTFLHKNGLTYPVVDDDEGKLVASLKSVALISDLPGTLVLDRKGRVAAQFVGPVLYTQLLQTLGTLAAEPA